MKQRNTKKKLEKKRKNILRRKSKKNKFLAGMQDNDSTSELTYNNPTLVIDDNSTSLLYNNPNSISDHNTTGLTLEELNTNNLNHEDEDYSDFDEEDMFIFPEIIDFANNRIHRLVINPDGSRYYTTEEYVVPPSLFRRFLNRIRQFTRNRRRNN